MKREYCLDIDGNVYTIGDLNMFLDDKTIFLSGR